MKPNSPMLAGLILSLTICVSATAHAQNVDTPFQVKIVSTTSQVDSTVSITNSGARGASTTPGNTAAITGAICANVYAYSAADGSLISCCSCPVAPNATRNLNVNVDLIAAPTSSTALTRTVVKVLASNPVANSCKASATNGAMTLTTGLVVTGTTVLSPLQVQPGLTIAQQSESPFAPSTLSAGELTKMITQCTGFPGGGANKVCASCP